MKQEQVLDAQAETSREEEVSSMDPSLQLKPDVSRKLALAEFFQDLTDLDNRTWAHRVRTVLDAWFPLDKKSGKPDEVACSHLFKRWSNRESKQYCPLSDSKPAPGSSHHNPAMTLVGRGALYGGNGRRFHGNVHFEPPIYFGDSVEIHSGARVIGPLVLGHGVTIYGTAIIKRSVIGPKTVVKDNVSIGYSLVGSRVFIDTGVTFSDDAYVMGDDRQHSALREFSHNQVLNELRSEELCDSPRLRFGAVIGDGCRIGAGSTFEPGVILEPGCIVPIGTILRRGYYRRSCFARQKSE